MRFSISKLSVFVTVALLVAPAFAATNVRRGTTAGTSSGARHSASVSSSRRTGKTVKAAKSSKKGKASARTPVSRGRRSRGQQAIDSERVTQIQQALIREHYLNQDANGSWDSATVAAMQKYQSDQGWQTKLMPDSRALKKLGLGPDYSGAINAKDSSFADPPPISTIPPPQSAAFAAAAGVSQ